VTETNVFDRLSFWWEEARRRQTAQSIAAPRSCGQSRRFWQLADTFVIQQISDGSKTLP